MPPRTVRYGKSLFVEPLPPSRGRRRVHVLQGIAGSKYHRPTRVTIRPRSNGKAQPPCRRSGRTHRAEGRAKPLDSTKGAPGNVTLVSRKEAAFHEPSCRHYRPPGSAVSPRRSSPEPTQLRQRDAATLRALS